MRALKNPYNLLLSLFLLCALFTIVCHLYKTEDAVPAYAEIRIRSTSVKNSPEYDGELALDSRYKPLVFYKSEGEYIMLAQGKITDAGFLISGEKYLSLNQKVSLRGEYSYLEGRIISVKFYQNLKDFPENMVK